MSRSCAALRVGPARESLRIFPNIVQNLSILSITAYGILCPKMKQKHQCILTLRQHLFVCVNQLRRSGVKTEIHTVLFLIHAKENRS